MPILLGVPLSATVGADDDGVDFPLAHQTRRRDRR